MELSGYTGDTEKIIEANRVMIRRINKIKNAFFVGLFFLLNGCQPGTDEEQKDTIDSGTIYISADESFKPVIDSEIQVFEALYPRAKIIPTYKPEAECIKDFGVDSVRMVIITRRYTQQEENFMVDSFKLAPKSLELAKDAVAGIFYPASPDTLFDMGQIYQIL